MGGTRTARRGWSVGRERTFLETLRRTGNVTAATAAAGLTRSCVYHRRHGHAAFRNAWREAMDEALDRLEAVLWEKALGAAGGENIAAGPGSRFLPQDDRLAIFLLKAHRPEIFAAGGRRNGAADEPSAPSPREKLLRKLADMTARERPDGESPDPDPAAE